VRKVAKENVNQFMRELMEKAGYHSVLEASKGWGIPKSTLYRWANPNLRHETFEAVLTASEKINITPEHLMRGLLEGQRKKKPN
jgi:hypothetical protein